MHVNIGNLCNAKDGKHGTPAPTYQGLKKKSRSTNNVEYKFCFCPNDIKHCVNDNKKKYVLDWHVVTNMWLVKIGTNLSRDPTTPIVGHKNKWESSRLTDGYYVVGVTPIPYHGFGVIIYVVSKANIAYHVTIGNIPYCTCLNFTKMSSQPLEKKGKWLYCKHLYYL